MLLQQGDLLLRKVEKMPSGKEIKPTERGLVLAEGEATGHAHVITEIQAATMIKTSDGKMYLKVVKTVPLKHDEHHIIIIEPGEYEVGKVLERDHLSRITREVID